jgi:hypothetical protein
MEEGNKLYKVIWQLGDDDEKSEKREEWIDRDPLWKQGGSIRQMMRNVDARGGGSYRAFKHGGFKSNGLVHGH